jgi:hypothetical protein
VGSSQNARGARDIAADNQSSNERRRDAVAGLVQNVINHDHVEAVTGAQFPKGIDVALRSVSESKVFAHNDALSTQALADNVTDKVGRTQAREVIGEWKHEARFDTGVTDEFNTTTRSRDVHGDTVRVEQTRRVSIEGHHHRVKVPLFGDVEGSPNHLNVPTVNGVELSDGDYGGLHSITEFGQRARDNHVRFSFRERVYR